MKKVLTYIAAGIMTLSVATACGNLGSIISNAQTAGSVAGKALKALLDKYLGNLGNLVNLGNLGTLGNLGNLGSTLDLTDAATVAQLTQIAKSIQGLNNNTSETYMTNFAKGIVEGTGNTISMETANSITNVLTQVAQMQNLTASFNDTGRVQESTLNTLAGPVVGILTMMK